MTDQPAEPRAGAAQLPIGADGRSTRSKRDAAGRTQSPAGHRRGQQAPAGRPAAMQAERLEASSEWAPSWPACPRPAGRSNIAACLGQPESAGGKSGLAFRPAERNQAEDHHGRQRAATTAGDAPGCPRRQWRKGCETMAACGGSGGLLSSSWAPPLGRAPLPCRQLLL